MMKGLAVELARYGIRANTILPGWIATGRSYSTAMNPDTVRDACRRPFFRRPTSTKTGGSTGTTTKTGDTKTGGTKSSGDTKAADPTKGYLQVFSKPVAKILVDGNDTGMKTPINGQALPLTPGKHKITFVIGDDRFTYPVMIKAGATETMTKDLQ